MPARSTRALPFAALLALGLSTTAATCASETRPEPLPDAGPVRTGPRQVLRVADGGFRNVGDGAPAPTAEDLPGFPLDDVLPSLSRQLLAYAQDAFAYDGCADTLQQCLKQPEHQRHALRMLSLATRLAAAGAGNVEISTTLNKYYAAFAGEERISFTLDKRLCRGPEDARVTVVEFSDFECPFCRMARPLLEGLVSDAGSVRLCFKPFPLKVHAHAEPAAEAALYAGAQGKFWEMHDALFDHQEALEATDLQGYATDLGLSARELAEALKLRAFSPMIEASIFEGKKAEVKYTPYIFVNGRRFELPLSADNLVFAVDDELEWQTHGGAWAPQ